MPTTLTAKQREALLLAHENGFYPFDVGSTTVSVLKRYSRPECPECHEDACFTADIETREVVDGDLVVTPVKAWDCGNCGHLFEQGEA